VFALPLPSLPFLPADVATEVAPAPPANTQRPSRGDEGPANTQRPSRGDEGPADTQRPSRGDEGPGEAKETETALLGFGIFGVSPYVTGGDEGSHVGTATGFRVHTAGISQRLSFSVDGEGRLGGGYGGFFTRNRLAGYVGSRIYVPSVGALVLRGGVDGRFVYTASGHTANGGTGPTRFARFLAPAAELSFHRFRTRDDGSAVQFEIAAQAGLAVVSSLVAAPFRATDVAAPAYGLRASLGAPGGFLQVSALRTRGASTTDELDGAACLGFYYALCAEVDRLHVRAGDATFASTRGLITFGIGIGMAETD
jgi:hypothetical protein